MSIRVVARIRPLLDQELDKDVIVRADSADGAKSNTIVKIPNPKNNGEDFSFAFNSVYDQSTTQEELFSSEVAPFLKSLFQGLDITLFAYGVTGTGKTHTMRGGLKLADRGVIPRLLSGVFRRGKKITKDSHGCTTVKVTLSYYEIYNDKVFDLLEPPEKRTAMGLPLRAEANGRTVVAGLSERSCEDLKDFEKMYIEANNNRVTAATKLNAHSSRSHAILRVKLTQITDETVLESTASAIDLAGSEDNRRTDNGKERLIESAAINKSLFVLSQCIDAISRGDKRIPYRESKMTRILSLGQNNGITVMILNLAPMRSYHLDTLSSLNVSSRAKRIEVREIENEVVFKQFPKTQSSHTGPPGLRQPLRPLANAHNTHNVNNGNAAKVAADPGKPVKAFSVYTDKATTKPPVAAVAPPSSTTAATRVLANTSQLRRTSPHKRSSDHDAPSRPGKIPRPGGVAAPASIMVSAAQLEALVEKKVGEILAARSATEDASDPTSVQVQPDISDAVQKRLDALERRIESDEWREDTRSEGLRYLLAARQSKEQGDDAGALKLYELALPFFPGQTKLLGKIERLRAKMGVSAPGTPGRRQGRKKRKVVAAKDDDNYNDAEADAEEELYVVSPAAKARTRKQGGKPRTMRTTITPMGSDVEVDDAVMSPRRQFLLKVVNSRDVTQIRGLAGFGAKKARDLTNYLEIMDEEGGDSVGPARIESLAQLKAIPGMGGKIVDKAYEALMV